MFSEVSMPIQISGNYVWKFSLLNIFSDVYICADSMDVKCYVIWVLIFSSFFPDEIRIFPCFEWWIIFFVRYTFRPFLQISVKTKLFCIVIDQFLCISYIGIPCHPYILQEYFSSLLLLIFCGDQLFCWWLHFTFHLFQV